MMVRDHSKAPQGRKNQGGREKKKIILFVEGRNTERSYFELLKRTNCTVEPVTVKGNGIGSCVEFVESAAKKFDCMPQKKREKFVQRWLVFDFDGHTDFETSIRMARRMGFHVAFSNMCVEYWFVLHFFEHDGKAIPQKGDSHSAAQIDMINRAIELYNRTAQVKVTPYDGSGKMVEEDFFDLMMSISPETHQHRILDAYARAKRMHVSKKEQGAEFRESVTTMYELLKELGVVTEGKGGTLNLTK